MIDVKELYITVIEKNSNKVKNQTHKRRRADRLLRNHSLSALFMFKKAIFTKSADCVLQLTKGIMMECKVCQQQDRFKRRFKLLSPSIYYGAYYAVEVILSLIYAALRTLE